MGANKPIGEIANVFGVIAVTQAMLSLLLEAPTGRIVNLSSGVGLLTLNSDLAFPYRSHSSFTLLRNLLGNALPEAIYVVANGADPESWGFGGKTVSTRRRA